MNNIRIPYKITEEWPTPIVKDFDHFLDSAQAKSAYLTKAKQVLDRKTLYALNQKMQTFQTNTHPRTDQEYYPLLNLFHRISMASQFFIPNYYKGKLLLKPTDTLKAYQKLNPSEKFIALVEAFWVNCDLDELIEPVYSFYIITDLLMDIFQAIPINKDIKVSALKDSTWYILNNADTQIIQLFSFFGFLSFHEKPLSAKDRKNFPKRLILIHSIKLSRFGKDFLGILGKDRSFELWNMPFRFGYRGADYPGQLFDEQGNEISKPSFFFEAFSALFPKGTLHKGCRLLNNLSKTEPT